MKQVLLFIAALWFLAAPALAQDDNETDNFEMCEGEECGSFMIDIEPAPEPTGKLFHRDGVFYFEGDMDASAELFLEFVNERAPEFSANG